MRGGSYPPQSVPLGPYVSVTPSDGADLVSKINAYAGIHPIFIPNGVYAPTTAISLTLEASKSYIIKGAGKGTRITPLYSLDPWFNITNSSYISGTVVPQLIIEDMAINVSAQNATHTLIDALYAHNLTMRNVTLRNSNSTHRGIGLKIGPGAGMRHYFENVHFSEFLTSVQSNADLITMIGCISQDVGIDGINFDLAGKCLTFINTQLGLGAGNCIGFKFGADTDSSVSIINTDWDTPPATATFFTNSAAAHTPLIDGFDTRTAGVTISDNYAKFIWRHQNKNALYKVQNEGTGTGSGAQQTIAHGLCGTPSRVILTEYNTGLAIPFESAAANATNIYVTATLNKTYRWIVSL